MSAPNPLPLLEVIQTHAGRLQSIASAAAALARETGTVDSVLLQCIEGELADIELAAKVLGCETTDSSAEGDQP